MRLTLTLRPLKSILFCGKERRKKKKRNKKEKRKTKQINQYYFAKKKQEEKRKTEQINQYYFAKKKQEEKRNKKEKKKNQTNKSILFCEKEKRIKKEKPKQIKSSSTEIFKARGVFFYKALPTLPVLHASPQLQQPDVFPPPTRVLIRDAHPTPHSSVCHAATPSTPHTLLSALQAAFNNANSTRLRQSSTLAFSPLPLRALHVHPHALQPSQSLQNTPLH